MLNINMKKQKFIEIQLRYRLLNIKQFITVKLQTSRVQLRLVLKYVDLINFCLKLRYLSSVT